MSQWTHVAAIIRLDGLLSYPMFSKGLEEKWREMDYWEAYKEREAWCLEHAEDKTPAIKEAFGMPIRYEDMDGEIPTLVPMGSEGSLDYTVVHTGSAYDMAWGFIAIEGDLRDYNDKAEITNWISDSLKRLNKTAHMWVRQGTVQISVEGVGDFYYYICDDGEAILTKHN
jgi:hypothetical protein